MPIKPSVTSKPLVGSFFIKQTVVNPVTSRTFYGDAGAANLSFYGTPSQFDNPHKTFHSELQGACMSFYCHQGNANDRTVRSFYG